METSFFPTCCLKLVTKFVFYNKRIQKRPAETFMGGDNAKKVNMKNVGEGGFDLL